MRLIYRLHASLPRVTRVNSYCARAAAAMSLVAVLLVPLSQPPKVSAGEPFIIETIVGTGGEAGYSGDGGPATDAKLDTPSGIAYDASGNLLFADWGNSCVRVVAATSGTFYGQSMTAGYIYTIAGTGVLGYSGDGGAGTEATLRFPQGVAVDGSGNAYIADSLNHCIRKVDEATGIITTIAGIGTSSGATGDGGPATAAKLYWPTGVAFDASGNLYIADGHNNRVRMIPAENGTFYDQSMTASYIYTIAGTGVWGYSGDGGSPADATLNEPYSTHIDAAGNLYIADTLNHRVRMVPATTGTYYGVSMTAGNIYTVAGTGSPGFSGDGGPAVSAELSWPSNMAIDSEGRMFIADRVNHRVREIDTDGIISTFAGTGDAGFSGDGGPATEATLGLVYGVTVNRKGDVFISDSDNDCIRVVFGEATPWLTYQGNEDYDDTKGLVVDADGYVYVTGQTASAWHTADGDPVRGYSGNEDAFVAKLDHDGDIIWYTFLGSSGGDNGTSIAVDADRVYVTGISGNLAWSQPGDVAPVHRSHAGSADAFVAVLDPNDGGMEWYTFLGGESVDCGCGIAVDDEGNIFVAGISEGVWVDASTPARGYSGSTDVFAAKLASDGSLLWHTFVGGAGEECTDNRCGIAVDDAHVFVTGNSASDWGENPVRAYSSGKDAFVAKFDADDGSLSRHTFLGGGDTMFGDVGRGIAIDAGGDVYITGSSENSWGEPLQAHSGGTAVLVARLTGDLDLAWHTFLGSGLAEGFGIAAGANGGVYVTGHSWDSWGSPDDDWSGQADAFAAKLSSGGTLAWNAFSGGSGMEVGYAVAADIAGGCVVSGYADNGTWAPGRSPVRAYTDQVDGFVVQYAGPASVSLDVDLKAGWNMVSVPVVPADTSRAAVFPPADVVAVYTWNPSQKSYEVPISIAPEVGYWVAVTTDKTITITGTPVTTWTSSLIAGWNMVGSVCGDPVAVAELTTDVSPDPLVRGAVYAWNPTQKSYSPADAVAEGLGYWVAVTSGCNLTMCAPVPL